MGNHSDQNEVDICHRKLQYRSVIWKLYNLHVEDKPYVVQVGLYFTLLCRLIYFELLRLFEMYRAAVLASFTVQ